VGIPWPPEKIKENLEKNIKLGLDLRGGSQLVLQVQVQDAFKAEAGAQGDRLRDALNKKAVDFQAMDVSEVKSMAEAEDVAIEIKGVPATKAGDFRSAVTETLTDWDLTSVNATDYRLKLKKTAALALRRETIKQTKNTIDRKINGLGLSESTVQERGSENSAEIMVQLPGVDDPARIKQILQTTALLEWAELRDERTFGSREEALGQLGGVLPPGSRLMRGATRGGPDSWFLVSTRPVITGRDLRDAQPGQSEMGRFTTNFVLTQEAAKRFERFTEANIGKRAAIILDNQVLSAPTIESKISDQGRITGAASQQEAADLALNLRAGSLPASVVYLEERSVGPSLGADSIRAGLISGVAGVIAVVLVMLVYYKKAGINATLALILNAIILIAALGYFGAVLTLPGIAGVILTIGMAVDSNVLIFERIREEMHAGKGVLAAIDAGFGKAFLTIIDTHVTTVVSCAFLFLFGSTQVKGFAVTLVIGLVANVFTAVFVSRFIFDWELAGKKQVTSLSI
jgi:preprotein translocase subunit SecD